MARFKPSNWRYISLLWLILVGYSNQLCLGNDADSLALRARHGLDEIGGGSAFFLNVNHNQVRTQWQSRFDALYRRSEGSQGELRNSGDFEGKIARSLRKNLDLIAILQSDYYTYKSYSGPQPFSQPYVPFPSSIWTAPAPLSTSLPLQRIEQAMVGLGGTYQPASPVKLALIIGQQWEEREGLDEQGLSASLSAELAQFEYRGFRNDLSLYLEQEELGARLNREARLDLSLDKRFTEQTADRLTVYFRRKGHDYHVLSENSIGTRTDTEQSLSNQLRYNLSPLFGLNMDTALRGSTHQDQSPLADVTRKEINTSNAFTLRGGRHEFTGWSRLMFDWGAQQDATGFKRERGTSLEGGWSWQPMRADSISFASAVRKRQYDTSDTSNYDDRDRLRYEFDVIYRHEFAPDFIFTHRMQMTLEHLVYIFAEKSDQNHWNRIFKLAPEISFPPSQQIRNLARFELVANTTDYDFELDPAFIKSTIYRRYTAHDSLSWEAARGWIFALEYTIDLEDGGRFLWQDWIQQLSEEYRTQQMTVLLNRSSQKAIRLVYGFSVYERKGWQYTFQSGMGNSRAPFQYLQRLGPMLQFIYPSASGVRIEANGDLSWVHEWNREDYTIVNLDVRVVWR